MVPRQAAVDEAQSGSAVSAAKDWTVAYVMTHYPRVALTFISGEIDEIERLGGRVMPVVMNRPEAVDLQTQEARVRQQRSMYLKVSPLRVLLAALATFARHPWAMARLAVRALTSARSDLSLMVKRGVHLCYAALAARHCARYSVNHLHAHFGQSPASIAWFASEIMNFRRDTRCTWSFTIHGFQDFIDESNARLDLKAKSAAFVVCISDFTKSQLCRVSGAAFWDRFHVIRCGIDLPAFPFRPARPIGPLPRIIIVGRLSPEKGHLTLLRAIKIVVDSGVETELEIVGSGPFLDAIRDEAAVLGLTDRVHYLGELLPEQVCERLAKADIFCMASFAEGIPISMMEAMAVGVPVVSTWVNGIPELAENEVTALTVPPGNNEILAAALIRLISNTSLRQRLAEGARVRVEQLHSRSLNVAQLSILFHHQIAGTSSDA
jgi:glycosyltransferase involved in cell wall biosynthesis